MLLLNKQYIKSSKKTNKHCLQRLALYLLRLWNNIWLILPVFDISFSYSKSVAPVLITYVQRKALYNKLNGLCPVCSWTNGNNTSKSKVVLLVTILKWLAEFDHRWSYYNFYSRIKFCRFWISIIYIHSCIRIDDGKISRHVLEKEQFQNIMTDWNSTNGSAAVSRAFSFLSPILSD